MAYPLCCTHLTNSAVTTFLLHSLVQSPGPGREVCVEDYPFVYIVHVSKFKTANGIVYMPGNSLNFRLHTREYVQSWIFPYIEKTRSLHCLSLLFSHASRQISPNFKAHKLQLMYMYPIAQGIVHRESRFSHHSVQRTNKIIKRFKHRSDYNWNIARIIELLTSERILTLFLQ